MGTIPLEAARCIPLTLPTPLPRRSRAPLHAGAAQRAGAWACLHPFSEEANATRKIRHDPRHPKSHFPTLRESPCLASPSHLTWLEPHRLPNQSRSRDLPACPDEQCPNSERIYQSFLYHPRILACSHQKSPRRASLLPAEGASISQTSMLARFPEIDLILLSVRAYQSTPCHNHLPQSTLRHRGFLVDHRSERQTDRRCAPVWRLRLHSGMTTSMHPMRSWAWLMMNISKD
jgi:hypothetical protein